LFELTMVSRDAAPVVSRPMSVGSHPRRHGACGPAHTCWRSKALAKAYDLARIAGQQCEREYDALTTGDHGIVDQ
jgi:hypothetical protein